MSTKMAEELLQMRRREPFQPFRVYIKSGESFDVLDPLEILVGDVALVLPVHVSEDPDDGYPAFLDVGQVVRIEPIPPSAVYGHAT